ncbi:hypothetical protein [Actinoplanes sp. NPDC026670]|uniref:hypothetical protein n=1 Tax=Actinoplanes sp. NPDC026670 TaxID=3154700 RepID=UPI0033D8A691
MSLLLTLLLALVPAEAARPNADSVQVTADAVYIGARLLPSEDRVWAVSRDAGATWTAAAEPDPAAVEPISSPECSLGRVCYRTVWRSGLHVFSSFHGRPWAEAWGVGEEQRRLLYRDYADARHLGELDSGALGVQDVPGGHVVVVANGRDGFAVRDPTGRWARVGFPALFDDAAPLPLRPGPDPARRAILVTLLALHAGLVMAVAVTGGIRPGGASRPGLSPASPGSPGALRGRTSKGFDPGISP